MEPSALSPVGKVWPEAVVSVPRRLKDGGRITPIAMLGPDTVLVMDSGTRKAFRRLDVRTGDNHVLARMPKSWTSCETCGIYVSFMTADASRLIFLTERYKPGYEGELRMELWSLPLSGGAMKTLVRLPTAGQGHVLGFAVTDDVVAWWNGNGIWRVPRTGGAPEELLPDRNLDITTWPWAYDRRSRTVVNMVTLQETKARSGDINTRQRCGPVWCMGQTFPPADKPDEPIQPFVQRVNGSGRTLLPGFPLTSAGLIRDRFAVLRPPAVTGGTRAGDHVGAWLYDRCAGKSGLVVFPDRDKAADAWRELRYGAATPAGPILFWETAGDSYTVLDLSRVPDATCAG